jgi:hemerythrin-like domain-containing protein
MKEHRKIERMVALLKKELSNVREKREANPDFLASAVDFMRTYADRCHHGKEEDILFDGLKDKKLSPEHDRILNELLSEHKYARTRVKALDKAKDEYRGRPDAAIGEIEDILADLTRLYPEHIEKEDKHFFLPVMDYFDDDEKEKMLKKYSDFDERLIHEKYENTLKEFGG